MLITEDAWLAGAITRPQWSNWHTESEDLYTGGTTQRRIPVRVGVSRGWRKYYCRTRHQDSVSERGQLVYLALRKKFIPCSLMAIEKWHHPHFDWFMFVLFFLFFSSDKMYVCFMAPRKLISHCRRKAGSGTVFPGHYSQVRVKQMEYYRNLQCYIKKNFKTVNAAFVLSVLLNSHCPAVPTETVLIKESMIE